MDLFVMENEVIRQNGRGQDVYGLITVLQSGTTPEVRYRAAIALGESDDPRAIRPLVKALEDEDGELRLAAVQALMNLESIRAAEALIDRLTDRNESSQTRQYAAMALGKIRTTRAIHSLRICTQDDDGHVADAAVKALEKIGKNGKNGTSAQQ
jgi:bilin biosynthesis protein